MKDKQTREPVVPYGKDPKGVMPKIMGMLKEKRFMTFSHENIILVAPALIITDEQFKEEMTKMDEVLGCVDKMLKDGEI